MKFIKSVGNPDTLWWIHVIIVWHISFGKWESDKFNLWPWIKLWQSVCLRIFFCHQILFPEPKASAEIILICRSRDSIEEPWWIIRIITVWLFIVLVLLCCCSGSLESHHGIFNLGQTKHQCVSAELQTFEGGVFFFLLLFSTGTLPAVASPCTMTSGVTNCQMATNHSKQISLQIPGNPQHDLQESDVICESRPGRSECLPLRHLL